MLLPLAHRFQPQLILVSAGYDAHFLDPIAQMQVTVSGFAQIARLIDGLAKMVCQGRLVFTLEGGYHLEALAHSIKATLQVLLWEKASDPWGPPPAGRNPPDISPILKLVRQQQGLESG